MQAPDRNPPPAPAGPDIPAAGIAVIIPHYNDVARLLRCLEDLFAMPLDGAEIVVVDNASTQSLDPVRQRFPGLRVVTEPQKGAAAARNRGVAETAAPLLLFLDADCRPAPDWLATARAVAGRAELVGGRIDVFDETPPPRSGAEAFETVFAFDCRSYVEQKGFSVTANLLTRRDVFADVGGFVVGLSEDLDWCHRATARGHRLVYEDALRVRHPTRSDWAALRRKWQRLTEEAFALNGTAPAARLRWGLRAIAMPASAIAHLPRIATAPALSGPGERAAAAATLLRLRVLRMGWMLRQAAGRRI